MRRSSGALVRGTLHGCSRPGEGCLALPFATGPVGAVLGTMPSPVAKYAHVFIPALGWLPWTQPLVEVAAQRLPSPKGGGPGLETRWVCRVLRLRRGPVEGVECALVEGMVIAPAESADRATRARWVIWEGRKHRG